MSDITIEHIHEAENDILGRDVVPSTTGTKSHVLDGIIDLAAGTAGGVANVYTGQPLDTVKVKMQTFPHLYKGSVSCFTGTLRSQGIRGLYAGTVPALAANVGENATLFTAYGFCQKGVAAVLGRPDVKLLHPVENALAGSLAAVFASLVLCPTELIKCRLQALREMRQTHSGALGHSNSTVKITPFSMTRQILRQEGVRGLFHGLTPTFAREVPGYFVFFGGYESCRNALTPAGKTKEDIGVLKTALSGGVGGASLWLSVFPADVVKSRVQIEGKGAFFSVFLSILRDEGFRALYRGLAPTLVRSFISSGSLFITYEYTKKALESVAS